MKHVLSVGFLFVLLVVGMGVALMRGRVAEAQRPEAAGGGGGETWVHVATEENTAKNESLIDHPQTNGNPNAILLVTQNWNPAGAGSGVYNDHEVGVYYHVIEEKWAVYNEGGANMPIGAAFNVLIPRAGSFTTVHTSSEENVIKNWTEIDNLASNNNPGAIVLTTHNYKAGGGSGGEWHVHSLGVWYAESGRWAIFNQDLVGMETGIDFNVHIAPADPTVFVHTANVTNTVANSTYLDHPVANGNPAAHLIVTQNWSVNSVYNDEAIGVWYNQLIERWAIFNQDQSVVVPDGAAFNVKVSSRQLYLPLIQNDGANAAQP